MGWGNLIVMMFVRVRVRIRMFVSVLALMMRVVRIVLVRGFLLAVYDYINLGCTDAAAIYTLDFEGCTNVQGINCLPKKIGGNSGVDERAEKHVAADPGKAVEIGDAVLGPWSLFLGRNSVARRASHAGQ